MKIWRLQTKTDGGDMAELCLKENIIAMGWPLDENDRKELKSDFSYDRYRKLANKHYSKRSVSPVERLVLETQQDDIVWMRHKGEYYFARIRKDSDWVFDFSKEAVESDTTNRRINIYWIKAGDESSVPGCLSTGFIRGTTYQQIKKQEVKMILPQNNDYSKVHDKYISAREIKRILNRGFYFASTIKTPFLSEDFIKSPEHLAKQGISEQKGVIEIYDKNFIRLPRHYPCEMR